MFSHHFHIGITISDVELKNVTIIDIYYTIFCSECAKYGKNDQNCPFLVIFWSKLAYLAHIQWHTQKNCVMIFTFIVMKSLEQQLMTILVLYLSP